MFRKIICAGFCLCESACTVIKEIRRQGETLTIIIITARKDDQKGAIAFKNGANDYITKPFRFSDLLERIKIHLSRG
ncbi:response regulator transcription factor [Nostoc edaphicum CCNP1411]|uniref:Response regulator transcription factor n=1 Tax=Nostoc edaphicum CCNP1411 TaxID=1472755 RepID=A0A7D7QJI4_9NOSO|nr:response regulator transcription factor [Nostoc edaphicum CCNP1411]